MVCVKEASNYIAACFPELLGEQWAEEVNKYANNLFSLTAKPKEQSDTAKNIMGGGEDLI
jgi:hypothetical protein